MGDQNPDPKNNLIDLASERQRMQTRSATLRGKKLTKTHKASNKSKGGIRWYHYLQLIVFLALVAWLMRSCNF